MTIFTYPQVLYNDNLPPWFSIQQPKCCGQLLTMSSKHIALPHIPHFAQKFVIQISFYYSTILLHYKILQSGNHIIDTFGLQLHPGSFLSPLLFIMARILATPSNLPESKLKLNNVLKSHLPEFSIFMNFTSRQERTPNCSVRLHRHGTDELHSFFEQASTAQEIHYTGIRSTFSPKAWAPRLAHEESTPTMVENAVAEAVLGATGYQSVPGNKFAGGRHFIKHLAGEIDIAGFGVGGDDTVSHSRVEIEAGENGQGVE
ncbi:hypothetical protein IEQ34_011876 [Dendrobium chrysotoxum]|uniref:Uncharacterized protein n=1 Tax=Dendrobium chrysotoxum TaxID=161865 RepID=A0AAV7GU45_DENCH|nr:hypothetical protein IEQ34_011876 [Dendrobium chrysotoxum]